MKNRYLLLLGITMSILLSGCGNSSSSDINATTGTTQSDSNETTTESEISTQLSGKTFYFIGGDDDAPKIHTMVFNKDLTRITPSDNENSTATTLDGEQLNLPDNESLTIKEVTDDYIVINFSNNGKVQGSFRLYSDKSKAEAYLESLNKVLSSLIVGTTQYTINTNGVLSDKVIKEDGVFTENVTLADGRNFDAIGTYTINDRVITFTRDSGIVIVATYVSHNSEYILLSASLNGGEAFDTYWFLTAEARDSEGLKLIEK